MPVGAAPWLLGYAGAVYGVTALVAGAVMVALGLARCAAARRRARGRRRRSSCSAFSILYLFVLFAVLLVESGLGGLLGRAAA